jgi:hypothetical protein
VPVDEAVTTATLTEDGRQVILAHGEANLMSAFDVKTGKLLERVPCQSPAFLLCRGNLLIVAEKGGKVGVFDGAHGWKPQRELTVADDDVVFLSAGRGPAFRGQVLATVGDDRLKRSVSG